MKNILVILAAVLCFSCSKDEDITIPNNEVDVTLSMSLPCSSGSMTRSREDVFNIFYNDMLSGELAPKKYSITFTEVNTGCKYYFEGYWDSPDMVTLRTGTYTVSGKTNGVGKSNGYFIQKEASYIFNETIEVTHKTTHITLNAIYNCYLLIFNKSNINSIRLYNEPYISSIPDTELYTFNDFIYCFVRDHSLFDSDTELIGKRTNNSQFRIYLYNCPFEIGKYYMFDDVTCSFNLPVMEQGN